MATGCRDCTTCTKPGLVRLFQKWLVGLMYLVTVGIAYVIKRGLRSHCPQCNHLLSNHARRRDGSFAD
ncbi:hypothetical protein DVA86_21980 [Streptomyces armeniacus]|uniref:Uncharacterized protein n=1 Tax=Streptomyces armeniacus TaxID=83291 RepID=A0A345XTE8_9ACTN|nr:hypothetical protein DVA86_21980 [Streptomyces armeniacus]